MSFCLKKSRRKRWGTLALIGEDGQMWASAAHKI